MRLQKILRINDKITPIVSGSFTLELNTPGRAIIAVQATKKLSGIVILEVSVNGKSAKPYFVGFISQSIPIDARQQRLFVQELGAVLKPRFPLALRNVSSQEILELTAKRTGLKITTDRNLWLQKKWPHFINLGSGYDIFSSLKQPWQCQVDGAIFVGVQTQPTVNLPSKLFTEMSATGATCAFLPALRPGAVIAIDNQEPLRIVSLNVAAETMRINWETS